MPVMTQQKLKSGSISDKITKQSDPSTVMLDKCKNYWICPRPERKRGMIFKKG